jgi:hypothetical protein
MRDIYEMRNENVVKENMTAMKKMKACLETLLKGKLGLSIGL